jgi:hypothetical protein
MSLKQKSRFPLVTRIRKISRPAIIVLEIAMLSVATAFGSPDAVPLKRDDDEIVSTTVTNINVVFPNSRLPSWRERFREKKETVKEFWGFNLGKAREKLMDLKKELHDHPSEEEIEERKRKAQLSLKG